MENMKETKEERQEKIIEFIKGFLVILFCIAIFFGVGYLGEYLGWWKF